MGQVHFESRPVAGRDAHATRKCGRIGWVVADLEVDAPSDLEQLRIRDPALGERIYADPTVDQ